MNKNKKGGFFMNGFVKWMMRHPILAKFLFVSPAVLLVAAISATSSQPKVTTFVFSFFFLLCIIWLIDACYVPAATKATKLLNDTCDYEPLLAVTEDIVRYAKPSPNKQVMQINYALCHICKGDFTTAKLIMTELNIDKFAGTLYLSKIVYYNNLSEVEYYLGNWENADLYFDKLYKMYTDLKPGKKKDSLASSVNSALALHLYRKGDYKAALEIMDAMKPNCLCSAVQNACVHARILIALGLNDRAKEALNFAIANGNKLYHVTEAKELLAQIS